MPVLASASQSPDSSSSNLPTPVYIAGFVLVGIIVIGLFTWLGIHLYRKRSQTAKPAQNEDSFLRVHARGLSHEIMAQPPHHEITSSITSHGKLFEDEDPFSYLSVPEKVHLRPGLTKENMESPKPFSFALSGGSPRSSFSGDRAGERSSIFRLSMTSQRRFSVMSGSSIETNQTTGITRKIRQIFNPVLPDELVIRVGEQLTVVQTFDDGWCVVGRENSAFLTTAKSLFKPGTPENNIEIGVIPAWCFTRPAIGLKAERPMRSSSLGITVQMETGYSSRNDLVSWSNF